MLVCVSSPSFLCVYVLWYFDWLLLNAQCTHRTEQREEKKKKKCMKNTRSSKKNLFTRRRRLVSCIHCQNSHTLFLVCFLELISHYCTRPLQNLLFFLGYWSIVAAFFMPFTLVFFFTRTQSSPFAITNPFRLPFTWVIFTFCICQSASLWPVCIPINLINFSFALCSVLLVAPIVYRFFFVSFFFLFCHTLFVPFSQFLNSFHLFSQHK